MRKMKNEKEIKRNLKNELNDTEPSSSLQNRVFSKLNVKETKKTFSFRKWVPALTCCLCVALIAVVGLVVGNSISKNNKAYNAIVQVDVNPSIEMVVDELDDRVLSGWIDFATQPIKYAEDGEPIKVDDENDADYISSPSCIISVYTSDEDIFEGSTPKKDKEADKTTEK